MGRLCEARVIVAMLHVLDGDATMPAFRAAGIEGDAVVWRESLLDGPWPRALRGVDAAIEAVERAAKSGDEIVVWFDEDLFCRVHAAYFAWRFPHARLSNATGSHARRAPDAMREELARRVMLDPALARAWEAYASADPRALVPLVAPFPWIRLHLERFPHARDGLSAVERAILRALRDGSLSFHDLHARVAQQFPASNYGLTDMEVGRLLRQLAPLVEVEPSGRAMLLDEGREVLGGRGDRVVLAPLDRWLGGVHLTSRAPVWRWNGELLLRAD